MAMSLITSRHPLYLSGAEEWTRWRLTYEAGEEFLRKYLKQFSQREGALDFALRMDVTPIPGFASSAINDIRNSIFQRMVNISRSGGSPAYREAINGLNGGVDRRGSTMNAFLGQTVLTDLLVMGLAGIYVDNTRLERNDLYSASAARPYVYFYRREDILTWKCMSPDQPSEFRSVLLRDTCEELDVDTSLPIGQFQRYRLLFVDEATGDVKCRFMDDAGEVLEEHTLEGMKRIPFVLLDIGDSLIKPVCRHQIALLNLVSSDVWYALKANFPFYTEQRDLRAVGSHLKQAATDGTATAGGQASASGDIEVGPVHGRAYGQGVDRPGFIHPSPEPLQASMDLQTKLEGDIRRLVNLAVTSMGSRQSAESKDLDNRGLEAGLSWIGLVLESGERLIAEFWASYEATNPKQRQVATIKYPDRYSLKSDKDRIDEAESLGELMYKVPGRTVKRELGKLITRSLLEGQVPVKTIDQINKEIDTSDYLTSDPKTIEMAKEQGLVGDKTASIALGFSDTEFEIARKDHEARIKRITEAQGGDNPAARGNPDMSGDPAGDAKKEKAESRDTTLKDTTEKPVRGEGQ